jgi:hypothetical protein
MKAHEQHSAEERRPQLRHDDPQERLPRAVAQRPRHLLERRVHAAQHGRDR